MEKSDIQKKILTKLLTSSKGFRYKEMRPEGVESDLYNYHLQQLVKKDLIKKVGVKYFLTENGNRHILEVEPLDPLGKVDDKFKVAVTFIIFKKGSNHKEILFQKRTRLPFANSHEPIGRGIHKGEFINEAAKRGLFQESGLTANCKLLGIVRAARFSPNGELTNDMFYFVCASDNYSGDLVDKNDFGENYWIDIDKAIELVKGSKHISHFEAKVLEDVRDKGFENIPMFYYEDKLIVDEY